MHERENLPCPSGSIKIILSFYGIKQNAKRKGGFFITTGHGFEYEMDKSVYYFLDFKGGDSWSIRVIILNAHNHICQKLSEHSLIVSSSLMDFHGLTIYKHIIWIKIKSAYTGLFSSSALQCKNKRRRKEARSLIQHLSKACQSC